VSLELIASVAGAAASVAAVVGAAYSLGRKIALLEARLSQLEDRVTRLEGRFASLEGEVALLRGEMSALKGEVGELRASFRGELASLEERLRRELGSGLAAVREELRREFRGELASLEERLKGYVGERVGRLARAFAGYQEFMLEYLSVKGLLEEREVRLAKGEARRLMELAANPFTREEWARLKQLLDKEPEELTLEEAYELRDLARKAIEEYGDRYEAYALHVYASIAVGLAYRRLSEKREGAGRGGGGAR
jgi:chromosome segregation ATPase